MLNHTSNLSNFVYRRGLYRVWIRANEAQNAPLVSVWIDPEMRAFEPRVNARLELPIESERDCHTDEGDARGVGHFLSRTLAFLAAAFLCVLLIPPAWSQSAGRITGTVKDQTNGAIPQATVAAVNIATGVKQSASTDDQGSYSFAVLSVGQHEIDVAADGFKPGRAQGLTININTALTVDVTPQVSEQNETVTVTETGALERDLRDARWRCSGFCNRSRATRSSDTGKGTREKHFLLRSF